MPDNFLGPVQLTAEGGHPGNDLNHAAIRRWTAPRDAAVQLQSVLVHNAKPGDGIRGFVVSSRLGPLRSAVLHGERAAIDIPTIEVRAGDSLDFIVDIGSEPSHDEFTWEIVLTDLSPLGEPTAWIARNEFGGAPVLRLDPWEQLAQVLLATNEFVFID